MCTLQANGQCKVEIRIRKHFTFEAGRLCRLLQLLGWLCTPPAQCQRQCMCRGKEVASNNSCDSLDVVLFAFCSACCIASTGRHQAQTNGECMADSNVSKQLAATSIAVMTEAISAFSSRALYPVPSYMHNFKNRTHGYGQSAALTYLLKPCRFVTMINSMSCLAHSE